MKESGTTALPAASVLDERLKSTSQLLVVEARPRLPASSLTTAAGATRRGILGPVVDLPMWTRGGEVHCGAVSTPQPPLLLLLQLRCPHQATDTRAPGECVGGVVRAAQLHKEEQERLHREILQEGRTAAAIPENVHWLWTP